MDENVTRQLQANMEISVTFQAIACCLIVSITFIYYHCRKKLSYWSSHSVEQLPSPHWLFGHFKEAILFRESPGWHLGQLYKRARQNAPFVGFYIFHKPCLLIRDPKIIRQMLMKDGNKFTDKHFAGKYQRNSIGLKNLIGARGEEWGVMRRTMAPVFARTCKEVLPLMTRTGEPMLQYIDSNEGKPMDVQELGTRYATDLIARVALGTETDSFGYPDGEFTRRMSEYFYGLRRMVALLSVFFIPDVVNWTGSLLLFNGIFIRKLFWKAMEERDKSGEKKGDFIDFAKKLQDERQSPLYAFTGDNLVHQAGTFVTGFESSAAVATFTLMELAKHQGFQEQARADIRQAMKHGWTNEAFREMKFLEQCIREAMRIHPQLSTLDRVAGEDYTIPGTDVTLKRGTAVYISLYGLHEDPQYFKDPGAFDPGRFHESATPSEAYMPLGLGPRMCPGSAIGLLHAKVVISLILANYEIHQNLEEQLVLNPRSTFTAADDGVNLSFRKLNSEKRIHLY